MNQTAKIIRDGQSQSVQLPEGFRFDEAEVFIRRDETTGEVILSQKKRSWDEVFSQLDAAEIPADFLVRGPNDNLPVDRDPFADWKE